MVCMPSVGHGQGGSCNVYVVNNPSSPGLVNPDVTFTRSPFMGGSATINGQSVRVWGFNSGISFSQFGSFPSPAIRVRQGQIVHTKIYNPSMPHTIHHHGIEPRQVHDGVGHTSFDVLGQFTYQWKASTPGTYIYHCHTNTVVHAEMGMYGALIVDPAEGPGYAADGTPYQVERVWAVDDIDPDWHCYDWDTALCGGDAGLNDFNPTLFCITGKGQRELNSDAGSWNPSIAVKCQRNQSVLLRYIVASYVPQRITFDPRLGDITIVAEDGRPLPAQRTLPAGSTLIAAPAERFDIILNPPTRGNKIPVDIEFLDYRTPDGSHKVIGDVTGFFNVS